TVREHLAAVLRAEGVPADEASLRLLAQAARGSMRDGLSLTDQAIAFGGGQLEEAAVRAMLGTVDGSVAPALVQALAQRDGAAVLDAVGALRAQGLSAAATLDAIAQLLQQMAVEQAVPGALAGDDPDLAAPRALAPMLPADETQLLYSLVLHGRQELPLAPDEHAGLAMVLLRFHAFVQAEPGVRAGAADSRHDGPAAIAAAGGADPAPVRAPAAALRAAPPPRASVPVSVSAPAASAAISVQGRAASTGAAPAAGPDASLPAPASAPDRALGDRWQRLVGSLLEQGRLGGLARELALQGALVAAEDPAGPGAPAVWTLEVAHEPLRADSLAHKLCEALEPALGGMRVELHLVAGPADDSPSRREAAQRVRRQQAAEQAIHDDPVVLEVLAQFPGARIVPGSIRPA
ncbi:MAG: polymerase gamma/tau subunit DnaX, partial [Pseudomonadota bacterium]